MTKKSVLLFLPATKHFSRLLRFFLCYATVLLCHSRATLCVVLRIIEHVFDRLANKHRTVRRGEPTNLSLRLLVRDRVKNADRSDSTPARKSVKMTIVECDEGPRLPGFVNPLRLRTLYSEFEVDKSLSFNASSRVLQARLKEFGRPIQARAGKRLPGAWCDGRYPLVVSCRILGCRGKRELKMN